MAEKGCLAGLRQDDDAGAVDNGQHSNYYFKVVVAVLLDYSGVITKSLHKTWMWYN